MQNRVDDVGRLLEDLRESGVVLSNYTLSIMVKLMVRTKCLGRGLQCSG